ncbi:hypothetical protein N7540_008646 [Penicillium herquei]|nr:hypothetical protein N7540_008646 [Penicillium herquei]
MAANTHYNHNAAGQSVQDPIDLEDLDLINQFEDSEDSESDGGMQLDDEPAYTDPNHPLFGYDNQVTFQGLGNRERDHGRGREEMEFSETAPTPGSYAEISPQEMNAMELNENILGPQPPQPPQRPRPRTRLSEEEYAALTVLNDDELLTMYALNSHRTIPQTRRLFLAKFIANGDRQREEELVAARFAVPASKAHLVQGLCENREGWAEKAIGMNNTTAYLVPASWDQVISHDDDSWWPPGQRRKATSQGNIAISSSSTPKSKSRPFRRESTGP